MMVNFSVIIMRESRIQNYRPKFKVPLYPWLPVFALISYTFLLFEMGLVPLLISFGFFVLGYIGYWSYSRLRVHRKSALMHVVERITAKELKNETLGKELRDIVIERDQIVEDRFDRLIRECEILDLTESMLMGRVFRKISSILSARIGVDKYLLYEGFMLREKQTGTVIRQGLAIPHVIVPGEKKFDILMVRCLDGLHLSCDENPVHTMFVLVGSMDERNYHLRALMAIAQIAQEPNFEKKWKEARNVNELRDVILLSTRKRDQN
jgi:mannitol/fructose-specific phosphotransferase system IIA component (Ntr-type)